jgi:hypothetical protein
MKVKFYAVNNKRKNMKLKNCRNFVISKSEIPSLEFDCEYTDEIFKTDKSIHVNIPQMLVTGEIKSNREISISFISLVETDEPKIKFTKLN